MSLALRLSGAFVAGVLFFMTAILSGHGFLVGILAYSFGGSAAMVVLTGLDLACEAWWPRSIAPAELGLDRPATRGADRGRPA